MRIAVTTDDGKSVAGHFGRCDSFLIYDAQEGQVAFVERRLNRHTPHARGECTHHEEGGGHAAHNHDSILEVVGDCQALIAGGMGWRAVAHLEERGIRSFVASVPCEAGHAVSLLLSGLLKPAGENACRGH